MSVLKEPRLDVGPHEIRAFSQLVREFGSRANWNYANLPAVEWEFPTEMDLFKARKDLLLNQERGMLEIESIRKAQRWVTPTILEIRSCGVVYRLKGLTLGKD